MTIKKRGEIYHAHFFVDGQRHRLSLETSDWREAQRKERILIAEAEAGKVTAKHDTFSRLSISDAADRFLADRIPQLAARSIQTERERMKPIKAWLGSIQVRRVTVDQIRDYIRDRNAAGRANATINRELDVIRGILKRAKRWHHFADDIHPLPVRQNIGQALTYEEKVKLLSRAGARPEWATVALAARLSLSTTMRGCELKQLRWQDIDFFDHIVTIRKSKTEAGERAIPLNSDGQSTIQELYRRAKRAKQFEPSHFVFPACENGHIDPTMPMKSFRTAWRRLTRVIQCGECQALQDPAPVCIQCDANIGKLKSPFSTFRFHDLRHQAITELAESKASDQTIMSIAGHISRKMLEHYSHVRMDAKRTALDGIGRKPVRRSSPSDTILGYDTNNDTNSDRSAIESSQVVDLLVELSGIEPLASSLRTRRSPS